MSGMPITRSLDDAGIAIFGRTGISVAHCSCSNMRLASGVVPVRRCLRTACQRGWAWTGRPRVTLGIC